MVFLTKLTQKLKSNSQSILTVFLEISFSLIIFVLILKIVKEKTTLK